MIICICKGLSERAIREVVHCGAETVADVGRACGAGTDCGTCESAIEDVIDEARLLRKLVVAPDAAAISATRAA